jgi:hypothetical protein
MATSLIYPSQAGLLETKLSKKSPSDPERKVEGVINVLEGISFYVYERNLMQQRLSEKGGTYVFKDKKGEILYIGETGDLYKRICNQHILGSNTADALFEYFYIVDVYIIDHSTPPHGSSMGLGFRKALEDILTKKINPMFKNGAVVPLSKLVNYHSSYKSTRHRKNWSSKERALMNQSFPSLQL